MVPLSYDIGSAQQLQNTRTLLDFILHCAAAAEHNDNFRVFFCLSKAALLAFFQKPQSSLQQLVYLYKCSAQQPQVSGNHIALYSLENACFLQKPHHRQRHVHTLCDTAIPVLLVKYNRVVNMLQQSHLAHTFFSLVLFSNSTSATKHSSKQNGIWCPLKKQIVCACVPCRLIRKLGKFSLQLLHLYLSAAQL